MKLIVECSQKLVRLGENLFAKGTTEEEALKQYEVPTGSIKIWDLPNGYEFRDENGNVINAQKIVLEKKKKEYPKTYVECCDTLYRNSKHDECYEACLQGHPMQTFARLLICRDAYWKIAGEEMGLEKPWEPDWHGGSLYLFYYNPQRDEFVKTHYSLGGSANSAFVFPTAEMRDAYMENFDPDIEKCKLLL